MSEGMILTYSGRNLLAKALTGKPLVFTRAFTGTGDLGSRDPYALTDLIARKLELPVTAMRTSATGTAEVTVEISNSKLSAGFFMKEYGLFAIDPDNNSEVLYSYCNKGDKSGYLEGFDGTNPISVTLSFITVIDQAKNITANITNSYSYVTSTTLDARIESQFAPHDKPAGFFSFNANDTKRFRPTPLAEAKKAIIGAIDVSAFNSRIERLEDAVNKISLAVNIQEIYPGASHYMAEDFIEPDTVDLYSAQVTSVITGDDSIDCMPADGLIPGSVYLLTDGVLSEYVQVESISAENGILRVILYEHVRNTYNIKNCRLVRTSADISSGLAYGAPSIHSAEWLPGTLWRGLGTMFPLKMNLDSSVSNVSSWELSGNAALDSNGAVSLLR